MKNVKLSDLKNEASAYLQLRAKLAARETTRFHPKGTPAGDAQWREIETRLANNWDIIFSEDECLVPECYPVLILVVDGPQE